MLKKTAFNILTLVLIAGLNPVYAQSGMIPLLPEGNMGLTIGTYSEIESGKSRVEFGFASINAEVSDIQIGKYPINETGILLSADLTREHIYLSGGYLKFSGETNISYPGGNFKGKFDSSEFAFRASVLTSGKGVFGVSLNQINESHSAEDTQPGITFSGSANHSYSDIQAGFSIPVSDAIRIGAYFSPEVSSKTFYNGDFSSWDSRTGHGALMSGGIGYNQPDFSAGFDVYSQSESKPAGSHAETGNTLSFQTMISEGLAVSFQYDAYKSDDLTDGGSTSPGSKGTAIAIKAAKTIDKMVIGGTFLNLKESSPGTEIDMNGIMLRLVADF